MAIFNIILNIYKPINKIFYFCAKVFENYVFIDGYKHKIYMEISNLMLSFALQAIFKSCTKGH